jgi:hypothetical protein
VTRRSPADRRHAILDQQLAQQLSRDRDLFRQQQVAPVLQERHRFLTNGREVGRQRRIRAERFQFVYQDLLPAFAFAQRCHEPAADRRRQVHVRPCAAPRTNAGYLAGAKRRSSPTQSWRTTMSFGVERGGSAARARRRSGRLPQLAPQRLQIGNAKTCRSRWGRHFDSATQTRSNNRP